MTEEENPVLMPHLAAFAALKSDNSESEWDEQSRSNAHIGEMDAPTVSDEI